MTNNEKVVVKILKVSPCTSLLFSFIRAFSNSWSF